MGGGGYGGERGGATSFTGGQFTGGQKGKGKGADSDAKGGGRFTGGGGGRFTGGDGGGRPGREAPASRREVPQQRAPAPAPAPAAVKFDKDGQKKIIQNFIDDNMFNDCLAAVQGQKDEDLKKFAEAAVFFAVDTKDRERRKVFEMLDQLLANCKGFTAATMEPGLGKLVTDIPDLIVDIPLICDYTGGFLGKQLASGNVSLDWFLAKCNEKNDPEFGMSVIEADRGGKLLGAIVKSLSKEDVAKAKINAASAAPFLGKESFDDFVKKAEVGDKF